jgi:hypothetical protein
VVLHRAAGDVNSAANGVELPFPHPGTGNSHRAGTAASAYNHDHGASTMITALAFKRRLKFSGHQAARQEPHAYKKCSYW